MYLSQKVGRPAWNEFLVVPRKLERLGHLEFGTQGIPKLLSAGILEEKNVQTQYFIRENYKS
jgi:hypothetical protein